MLLTTLCFMSGQLMSKELQKYFESPKLVGEARLSVLFWDVYDAKLIAPNGVYEQRKPFALELTYLRDFKGKDIASRSVDEMRKLGVKDEVKLAKWYQEMQDIFPDVSKNESITGVVDEQLVTHFYYNDSALGKVYDQEFSEWFFNIWLSEKTAEPKMRKNLLGIKS